MQLKRHRCFVICWNVGCWNDSKTRTWIVDRTGPDRTGLDRTGLDRTRLVLFHLKARDETDLIRRQSVLGVVSEMIEIETGWVGCYNDWDYDVENALENRAKITSKSTTLDYLEEILDDPRKTLLQLTSQDYDVSAQFLCWFIVSAKYPQYLLVILQWKKGLSLIAIIIFNT